MSLASVYKCLACKFRSFRRSNNSEELQRGQTSVCGNDNNCGAWRADQINNSVDKNKFEVMQVERAECCSANK